MVSKQYDRRVSRFVSSVSTTYVGVLATFLIAFLTTEVVGLWLFAGGSVAGLLVVGIAEYKLTYEPLLQYRDRQLNTFLDDYLATVESDIESLASDGVEVRANVMRPQSDGFFDDAELIVSFTNEDSDYRDGELELRFDCGQGCAGATYESGQQMFAVRHEATGEWPDAFRTTEVQDAVTEHLEVIVATPIYRPQDEIDDDPAGVLVVDTESTIDDLLDISDSEDIEDLDLKTVKMSEELTDISENIGILL